MLWPSSCIRDAIITAANVCFSDCWVDCLLPHVPICEREWLQCTGAIHSRSIPPNPYEGKQNGCDSDAIRTHAGFPNALAGHRLNHSATLSRTLDLKVRV